MAGLEETYRKIKNVAKKNKKKQKNRKTKVWTLTQLSQNYTQALRHKRPISAPTPPSLLHKSTMQSRAGLNGLPSLWAYVTLMSWCWMNIRQKFSCSSASPNCPLCSGIFWLPLHSMVSALAVSHMCTELTQGIYFSRVHPATTNKSRW